MSLNQFLLDVGFQLQDFIWEDVSQKALTEEIHNLEDRIRQGSTVLAKGRTFLQELHARVAEKEQKERWLASRVEVYLHVGDQPNAWRHALELDQLRNLLGQERERLHRRRRTYREQQAYLTRLQQELADYRQQLWGKSDDR
jgi:hypothetical protein